MPKSEMYVAHLREFDRFFQQLLDIKLKHEIKNASVAMLKMMEMVQEKMEESDKCHS